MTQQKYLDNQGKVGILEVTAADEKIQMRQDWLGPAEKGGCVSGMELERVFQEIRS